MIMVNLQEKLSLFNDHWSPRVVAEMNDVQFKLVKIQGDFVWHSHAHTDEVFLVLEGQMAIEMREETVHLREGEMYVVKKGVEHRPYADEECKIMIVEPRGVVNTGEVDGAVTAPSDVGI